MIIKREIIALLREIFYITYMYGNFSTRFSIAGRSVRLVCG